MFPLDEKKARKRFLKSFGILGLIMCALTIGIGNFYVYKMSLGQDHVILTGHQMTNLLLNLE